MPDMMPSSLRVASASLIVLSVALLSACGGSEPSEAGSEMAQDTFIKPIERQPLTEADMVGFDLTHLALELPWTRNSISRDAAVGAPPVAISTVEVVGHEGFDRVTFATDGPVPDAGYEIRLAAAGDTVACGPESHAMAAERTLVVAFAPATVGAGEGARVPSGVRDAGAPRMARAGLLCDVDGVVIWVAELASGDQMRVLELREPGRIVVDVR